MSPTARKPKPPAKQSSAYHAIALGKQIPAGQLDMPAGFQPDGQLATLRQVVNPNVPTLSLAELSPEQRSDLVVKRIALQPKFSIAMVGAGIVDQDRAIQEVKSQSKVGRVLEEIEQRVINNLVQRAIFASKPEPAPPAPAPSPEKKPLKKPQAAVTHLERKLHG